MILLSKFLFTAGLWAAVAVTAAGAAVLLIVFVKEWRSKKLW